MDVFFSKLFVAKLHFQTRSKKDNFFEPKKAVYCKLLFTRRFVLFVFFTLVFIFYFGCFLAIFNAVFVEIPDQQIISECIPQPAFHCFQNYIIGQLFTNGFLRKNSANEGIWFAFSEFVPTFYLQQSSLFFLHSHKKLWQNDGGDFQFII